MKKKLVSTSLIVCLVLLTAVPVLAQPKVQEFANEPLASDFPAPDSFNPNLSTTKTTQPVSPQVVDPPPPIIVLDPGHGGSDGGASGNGLVEKNLTLNIANKTKNLIYARWPATVYMTRTSDVYVSLDGRVNYANSTGADFFVSNHINSSTDASANGVETYWQKADTSQELATDLQNKLIQSGLYNRGVKQNNYYVITYSNMPAALAETGFISNSSDASQLSQDSFQDTLASELVTGMHLYWWGF
ncbi:MAG: N-acetylmuramoyl-L-alanine amidase [Desulfitobacteriaceae bacterium]|nr:N-acetylmuramoyl-L-alanine amidase [Desulfitobacteriaceae bacterium]MDI6915957.1 N-acetylmuramoyl-L-alanine amidase [Desulfitobacteriaceae bacterium]